MRSDAELKAEMNRQTGIALASAVVGSMMAVAAPFAAAAIKDAVAPEPPPRIVGTPTTANVTPAVRVGVVLQK